MDTATRNKLNLPTISITKNDDGKVIRVTKRDYIGEHIDMNIATIIETNPDPQGKPFLISCLDIRNGSFRTEEPIDRQNVPADILEIFETFPLSPK